MRMKFLNIQFLFLLPLFLSFFLKERVGLYLFQNVSLAYRTGKKTSLPSPAERFFKPVKRMNYSTVSMLTAGHLGALMCESGGCMNALIVMLCVHSV